MWDTIGLVGYVGPGAGMGAVGALLGLVFSVLLALGVLLLWPVRMLLRRVGILRPRRPSPPEQVSSTQPAPEPAQPPTDV